MAPKNVDYQVTDVHGKEYIWTGADPSAFDSVFQWGDPAAMTMLHCRNDEFVNIEYVVSLKPAFHTLPVEDGATS